MKAYIAALLLATFLTLGAGVPAHALTVVNQGPGAVNNFPPNNVVACAVTSTITKGTTISWGLQGGAGSLNCGTITIPANQTVGFGQAAVPAGAAPGQYTLFATEGGTNSTDGSITVQGPPQQPTQAPVLTTIEDVPLAQVLGVYITRKTEVKVVGTCEFAGMTIEILIDGNVAGSVYTTSANWGYTVTVPNDGNPHAISARNSAGSSTSVQVQVDTARPTYTIAITPASPLAASATPVKIRVTASEKVRNFKMSVLGNGMAVPAPLTLAAVGAGTDGASQIWEGDMTIAAGANGAPTIAGSPCLNGTARFIVTEGYDLAKPDPGNLGTQIISGEDFIVQVDGPSSIGAKVIVEGDAQFVNHRNLAFTWQGFTHPLGNDAIQSYWYRAFPAGQTPAGANNDTQGWTNFPAATGTTIYNANLNVDVDGTVSVYVKAADRNNNFSSPVFDAIIVDTTGPVASNPFPANGASVTDAQTTVSVELTDPNSGSGVKRNSIVVQINGVNYGVSGSGNAYDSPGLTYGPSPTNPAVSLLTFNPKLVGVTFPRGQVTCSVTVATVDNIGNPIGGTNGAPGVAFNWTFNVNTNGEAPVARLPVPTGLFVNNKRPPIRLNIEDPDLLDRTSIVFEVNGASYSLANSSLTLQDGAGGAAGSISVLLFAPPTDLADGTVSCSLRAAKDRVGNAATPFNWTFNVDTTGPEAKNPSPGQGITVESATQIVSLEVQDLLSGVDPATFEVRVIYQPTYAAAPTFNNLYTVPNNGLVYNPGTHILSFNPVAATPAAPFGQGSITVILNSCQDRAVTYDATTGVSAPLPNALKTPFQWTFLIGSSVGPIVSDITPPATPISTLEPLVVRFALADPDFIDHASLIFDFNGRTFRDGDLGVSWTTGTSSVLAGTHEVVLFDPPDDGEIVQGTNTVTIRAAKDRSGNALQQAPVTHRFAYDTEGPKASANEPVSVLYDRRQKVFFTLNDNYSGVLVDSLTLTVVSSGGTTYDFGTTTSPANLTYSPATSRATFTPSFDYVQGQSYTFRVETSTRDKAGNPLGKTIGGTGGSPWSFTLRMAGSNEVVVLSFPPNASYQNVTALDEVTREMKFRMQWRGPLSGLPTGGGYELVIADNFGFDDQLPNHVWKFGTTATTFRDETLQVLLQHGNIYYWYVNAATQLANGVVPDDAERFAKSSVWSFTVDNLPPVQPDIKAVIDFRNIEPDHVNEEPYSKTTYVMNSHLRVRTYCYEEALATEGYVLQIYNVIDNGGTTKLEYLLGTLNKTICAHTQEIDIDLPLKDGLYNLIARVQDRAGNFSLSTKYAPVYLDRTAPKVQSVTITDRSPNTNGYITSGQSYIEIEFEDAISLLPLAEHRVQPQILFDPAGPGVGTAPVEVTNLSIKGKSIQGMIVVPYGQSKFYDGMADVSVTGVMDAAYNMMDGGYYYEPDVFEIDTAPSFTVKTFLNPVDEKNVLINIYASETMMQAPTLWITTTSGIPNNVPVNIMARDLFASAYDATVGENMIRVSGPDAKGNVGLFPIYENSKESNFLVYAIAPTAAKRMASANMGIDLSVPAGAVDRATTLFVFPYQTDWADDARPGLAPAKAPALSSELVQAGMLYNLSPARIRFQKAVRVAIDLADLTEERRRKAALYASDDGVTFRYLGGEASGTALAADVDGACILGAFVDETAPRIRLLEPAADQPIDGRRPRIRAALADGGSGVTGETVSLMIDGVAREAAFDAATGELTYDSSLGLGAGAHNLEIIARDRTGNVARSGSVAFTVPKVETGIVNPISYPNPARALSTVSFKISGVALGEPLEVRVKVYDGSGRMVRELEPLMAGFNVTATWDLSNGRGRTVANGTYVYKIFLTAGTRTKTATGKIAVLR